MNANPRNVFKEACEALFVATELESGKRPLVSSLLEARAFSNSQEAYKDKTADLCRQFAISPELARQVERKARQGFERQLLKIAPARFGENWEATVRTMFPSLNFTCGIPVASRDPQCRDEATQPAKIKGPIAQAVSYIDPKYRGELVAQLVRKFGLTKSAADAEVSTFISEKLNKVRNTWPGKDRFGGYLAHSLRNYFLNKIRGEKRREKREREFAVLADASYAMDEGGPSEEGGLSRKSKAERNEVLLLAAANVLGDPGVAESKRDIYQLLYVANYSSAAKKTLATKKLDQLLTEAELKKSTKDWVGALRDQVRAILKGKYKETTDAVYNSWFSAGSEH